MNEKLSTWRWALGGVLLISAISLGLWGITTTDLRVDQGEYEQEVREWSSSRTMLNPIYSDECGSCHIAYPIGMLPARSWQVMMAGLDDHFGENAEVDKEIQQQLEAYLLSGSADNGTYQNRRYLSAISDSEPVLRITEMLFFKKEHDEIPVSWVQGNDEVGSFSQCDSCHQSAAQGNFDEDRVVIPGYGRWDD